MRYFNQNVFIVKDSEGTIHKVFGIEAEAEAYVQRADSPLIIDVWPCEFAEERKK